MQRSAWLRIIMGSIGIAVAACHGHGGVAGLDGSGDVDAGDAETAEIVTVAGPSADAAAPPADAPMAIATEQESVTQVGMYAPP